MDNIELLKNRVKKLGKNTPDKGIGDVMVVGGGISGIQASLDLASSGFKVYLVEKGSCNWGAYGTA